MKITRFLPMRWIVVLSLFVSLPLLADDEDRPSKEHVLGFLQDKLPETRKMIDRVGEREGEEEYEELLEEAREVLREFLEIKREEGAEVAEAFLDEERERVRREFLVDAWRESDDEEEKEELKSEIERLIARQIDREIEGGNRHLERLEREVGELEEELAEMEERRDEIVAEELDEILSEEEDEERGGLKKFFVTQSWSQEEDYRRPYWVNVPEGGEEFPVLIFLHGNGGNSQGLQRMVFGRYPEISRRYITVFPEGYGKSWNIVSERSKADDRGFVEEIIRGLSERDDVRKNEFSIMGISNGAALVNQIAIESPLAQIRNLISSVSPLNTFQHDGKNFKAMGKGNNYAEIARPKAGRRLLNVSGTNDHLVPYGGGPSKAIPAKGGKLAFVDAEESIFLWAKQMGYEGEKLKAPNRKMGKVEVFSYLDGDVVHFKVNDHGHNATGALNEELLLEFLKK